MGENNNSEYESSEGEEAKYSTSCSEGEQEETENSKRTKKSDRRGNGNDRNVKTDKKTNDSVSRKRAYKKDDDHDNEEEDEEEEERYRAKRAARPSQDVVIRVIVPSNEIGKVIGKQGATIKQLREETGARIKIADPVTALEDRVIIISSKADESKEKSTAEHALIQIVNVILKGNERDTATAKSGSRHVGPNMIRLLIADSQAGGLIGISGNTIKETRKISGASVHIMPRNHLPICASASETDRLVQISGEVSQVMKALEHIGATLRENPAKEVISTRPAYYLAPAAANRLMLLPQSVLSAYAPPSGNLNSHHSRAGRRVSGEASAHLGASSFPKIIKEITIPSYVVGGLIGRGGSNISEIRSRSGATVKITGEKDVESRTVHIEGTREQVDIAQNMVDTFLSMESF